MRRVCPVHRYGHAAFASLYYSIEMDAPIIATIYGPKGRIHINHRAHNPESITLVLNGASLNVTLDLSVRSCRFAPRHDEIQSVLVHCRIKGTQCISGERNERTCSKFSSSRLGTTACS